MLIAKENVDYDKFWSDDPRILFQRERLHEFLPYPTMSFAEKLNAVIRLTIYMALLLLLFRCSYLVLYLPIAALGMTFMMNRYERKHTTETFSHKMHTECQQPDANNPFMNVLLSDYSDAKNRRRACTIQDDVTIPEQIEKNFDINLFRDVDDVWNNENSQRQFFTMPSTTIPNDQKGLGNWLYNTGPTLKERDLVNYWL